jgi:hypothetical protein
MKEAAWPGASSEIEGKEERKKSVSSWKGEEKRKNKIEEGKRM